MSIDSSKLTRRERRSAIVGMLMGDASLYRHYSPNGNYTGSASISIAHSAKQREYLLWKMSILQPMFGYELRIQETTNKCQNGKTYPVARLTTRVNPQLTRLHKLIYVPTTGKYGRKHVTPQILDMLDDRAVAIWYQDDGCLSKTVGRGATVIFATNNFTLAENELIREWLFERYGVMFNINEQTQSGTYNLRRGISDAHLLLDAIKPYVVPTLQYKVDYPTPKRAWYSLSKRPAPLENRG